MNGAQKAETDGIVMRYAKFGKGKKYFTVLPGLSASNVTDAYAAIEPVFQAFYGEYTVYLLDRRDNVPEGYTVLQMAQDTAKVLKHLGVEKTALFGASQGGMVALALALEEPRMVEKLVLGSTAGRISEGFRQVYARWVALGEARDSLGLTAHFADHLYGEKTLREYRQSMMDHAPIYTEGQMARFTVLARAFGSLQVWDRLGEIRCPCYVIGSTHDRVFGAESSPELAEKLGCPCRMYDDGSGHGVYDERPDYYAEVLAFLQK